MDRERMKELVNQQKAERMAQTQLEAGHKPDEIMINQRMYRLVANYRDAYQVDQLKARFSTFLEKYDFLVGDIAADQLRIRGFYQDGTNGVPRNLQISALQDYLYEDINFGAPYFVLENLEPHEVVEEPEDIPKRRNRRHHRNRHSAAAHISEKTHKVADSKKKRPVKKGPGNQVVTKGKRSQKRFKIHERKVEGEN
ncbi:YutD family protein [Weissella kandleri]|uniref:YutD family protein n=1 Tax=Weissella kandleri TaxID=1616 RepID=UPI00387E5D78